MFIKLEKGCEFKHKHPPIEIQQNKLNLILIKQTIN